jgi:hypothetical protein
MGNNSDCAELPLGGGFFGISNTKWSYTKSKKGAEIGYDNKRVKLDEETRETITDCMEMGETPKYIKQLDSLFFGYSEPAVLISPYGRIKLPEGLEFAYCKEIPAEMTSAAIFAAMDPDRYDSLFYEKANFIAVRDGGDGKYSWAYLFPKWGMKTKTQPDETGFRLMLLKKGKSPTKPEIMGEIHLPEGSRTA